MRLTQAVHTSAQEYLIGRERERAELQQALSATLEAHGGMVLLAGEAGVGKTRLAETVLTVSAVRTIHVGLNQEVTPPYGPMAAALRACLRDAPNAFATCGPLLGFLALILPELGPSSAGGGRGELFEAIRCAFQAAARDRPLAILFDDLQWADNASLELFPALADSFTSQPLLLVGLYRSDEIPRGHPLRRLRTELRRKGILRELSLDPLNQEETTLLAARVLGSPPSPALAATVFDRTQGVPFFVEELAAALGVSGRVQPGRDGTEVVGGGELPIPETLRDAILLRAQVLSDEARRVLEIAAVVGVNFEIDLLVSLAGTDVGLAEATESGLFIEKQGERAAFRHALVREAIYGEISWSRRRALHREVATRLERQGAPLTVIAQHWRAGRDLVRARQALITSVQRSCTVYAYEDAAAAARQALDLWPDGEDDSLRLDVLARLGYCTQMNGDLTESRRAWEQVVEGHRPGANRQKLADAERALAGIYELQGAWEEALEARQQAAVAYEQSGLADEAATEQLAAAAHLRSAGQFRTALDLLAPAAERAREKERWDLQARIMGLEGNIRSRMGEHNAGIELARRALAIALEHKQVGAAAEVYQRLADTLEHAGDYTGAKTTYNAAFEFCTTNSVSALGQVCLACLAVVLVQTGEWERALEICREVLASRASPPHAMAVGNTVLGLIHALRGVHVASQGRPHLLRGIEISRRIELAACELMALWGLAIVDELDGAQAQAAERYRTLIGRWQHVEDRHYAISPLRWAVTLFGRMRASPDAHAAANALATIAAANGQAQALSALAHALGEIALMEGHMEQATEQFTHSVELLDSVEAPLERAETLLRAGVAMMAGGNRQAGVERILGAYHIARKLKAQPLADAAVRELAAHGEPVEKRLGRKASRALDQGRLTRREMEILPYLAVGRTNREIAQALFLSPRTVDMFVRNILSKLDSHSRMEAVHKAQALGWLSDASPNSR